jgi:hypothetical protein
MTRLTIPWPIRGVLGGTAGTATMTLAYETERRLRHNHQGQLDYDDSPPDRRQLRVDQRVRFCLGIVVSRHALR